MQRTIPHAAEPHTGHPPLLPTTAEFPMKDPSAEQSGKEAMSNLTPAPGAADALRRLSSTPEVRCGDDSPTIELQPYVTGLHTSGTVNGEEHDVAITSLVVPDKEVAAATPKDDNAASSEESGVTPVKALPPAAPALAEVAADSAVLVSSAPELSSTLPLPVAASDAGAATIPGTKAGAQTSIEHMSPIHFTFPALPASTTSRSGFRRHGDTNGACARGPGRREPLKRFSVSRHLAPGALPVHRRNNFSGCDGVNYENFFFYNEGTAAFGIGTVGLFAATAKPVTGSPRTVRRGLLSPAHYRRAAGEHRQRSASQLPPALPSCRASLHPTLGAASTVPCYYTPACYTSPAVDGVTAWKQRQEDYRNWRCENLIGSTYYRLSNPFDAGGGAGRETEANDGVPSLLDVDDAPALYSADEIRRIERLRLRGLQAERTARSTARAHEQTAYEEEVLLQRMRKLRGEAVDLPDSYLRATYPDPSTLTGYAELVTEDAKACTYPGPHRSKAASGYLANPQRVVKDHHCAMHCRKVAMQQARLDREAKSLRAAERQRRDTAAQLTDCQLQQAAYLAAWMEGRPRLCRARETEERVSDLWKRSTQAREREMYNLYTSQEAKAARTCQQERRARASAAQSNSQKGIPGGNCLDQEVQPLPPVTAAEYCGAAARLPRSPSDAPDPSGSISLPPQVAASPVRVMACQAAGEKSLPEALPETPILRPVTPALPPSQLVGPTSTNFFNEVKQWAREFSSPNTVPSNGADTAYRRAWKAELDEAQVLFNREATQRQRVDIARRVQEAREKAFEGNWQQAEQERHEKRELATRRTDHTQADVETASANRLELHEEIHRAQQQRMVQAAERYTKTQFSRQQSKQREMVLRSLEAVELQQLRVKVSSALAANRG